MGGSPIALQGPLLIQMRRTIGTLFFGIVMTVSGMTLAISALVSHQLPLVLPIIGAAAFRMLPAIVAFIFSLAYLAFTKQAIPSIRMLIELGQGLDHSTFLATL